MGWATSRMLAGANEYHLDGAYSRRGDRVPLFIGFDLWDMGDIFDNIYAFIGTLISELLVRIRRACG